jgi:hypothetical protein
MSINRRVDRETLDPSHDQDRLSSARNAQGTRFQRLSYRCHCWKKEVSQKAITVEVIALHSKISISLSLLLLWFSS